jgi:F0F1-type ATP synthase membrane subunit c/vacuolar-type H+-ATPase subunit K
MADCAILGDSIAVGLGLLLNAHGWACAMAAHVGAVSADLPAQIERASPRGIVLLSMGSNDRPGPLLEERLFNARANIGRARVLWVLPYHRRTAYSVSQIAFRFGDEVLDLARFPTRDHVHPAHYAEVAGALLR